MKEITPKKKPESKFTKEKIKNMILPAIITILLAAYVISQMIPKDTNKQEPTPEYTEETLTQTTEEEIMNEVITESEPVSEQEIESSEAPAPSTEEPTEETTEIGELPMEVCAIIKTPNGDDYCEVRLPIDYEINSVRDTNVTLQPTIFNEPGYNTNFNIPITLKWQHIENINEILQLPVSDLTATASDADTTNILSITNEKYEYNTYCVVDKYTCNTLQGTANCVIIEHKYLLTNCEDCGPDGETQYLVIIDKPCDDKYFGLVFVQNTNLYNQYHTNVFALSRALMPDINAE